MADDIVERLSSQLQTVARIKHDQDAWHLRHPGLTRWNCPDQVWEIDPFPDGPLLTTSMWVDLLEVVVQLAKEARRD